MKLLIITFLSLIMFGCSSISKIVDIPIPLSCPTPQIPPKPKLLTANLLGNESPNVVQKAEVSDLKTLMDYSDQLIAILKGYQ